MAPKRTAARGPYKIPTIYPLPDSLALRQKIRVSDAARLNAIHEDTFRKEHSRLIKKVSENVEAVELGDALSVGIPKVTV
jgi:hypothetical protein